ncbi:MAG: hypothetical protein ABI858_08455 [Pseudoxanthomonas sp.]
MKKNYSSELYASLSESSVESNSSDFETLSLRISHKTAAMVQAFNVAFQQPVLALFTDGISQHLAESLLGSVDNEILIAEEAGNGIQPDSALDFLVGADAIKYDGEALRRIREIFMEGE